MDRTELENLLNKGKITLKEYENGIDRLNGKKKGTFDFNEKDVVEVELSYEEKHLTLLQNILENSEKTARNTRFIVNYIIIMILISVIYVLFIISAV